MKKLLIILSIFMMCISHNSEAQEKSKFKNITATVLKDAVLAGGQLIRVDRFPTKNIEPRSVDVWLPENYSNDKKYAVLYMHDGQNLFDATTTWNKQEWMVDEIATKLMNDKVTKEFIVVGIHNIPKIRWQDLFPEKAMGFMDSVAREAVYTKAKENNFDVDLKGDEYLQFLVEELKPYIDTTYATAPDKENTFVGGASMGGLMSMYAIAEYPEVFAGAACISTHWPGVGVQADSPFPKAIFSYLEANVPSSKTHKMYFDFGTKTLDQYYPQYEETVNKIFTDHGYTDANFKNLKFEGADHSERSWQKRFDIPLTFLLKK